MLLTISCTRNVNKFERKEELLRYLTNIQRLNITDKSFDLYIIQVLKCGKCTETFLKYLSENAPKKSIIIFSNNYTNSIVAVLKTKPNIILMYDVDFQLSKYGLSTADDLFVRFENGKITKSRFIDNETVNNLDKIIN